MAIIGIDLGTTNSACGVWRNGKAELIPNRLGDILTPSVVGVDENNQITVGKIAKERLISHSNDTVAIFKRIMGTDHKIKIGEHSFNATELSSFVLRSLKEDAETYLGETVTEAIISVPAYFNDNQRYATKSAGELIGLKVERLINEPTAAAIAYGLNDKAEGTFLILDMGGGTFDVSILEFFDGIMEVHASAGDNFLGGEDFVDIMANSLLTEAEINKKELKDNQLNQLLMQMETVKRNISLKDNHNITLQLGKHTIESTITEDWFNKTIAPLLLRIKRPIERALRDADMRAHDLDDIVLVGGATRMSAFRSTIGRMFGRLPSCHLDPDTVVTIGAAIQAGLKSKDAALDDIVLTDVCPYTLGTEISSDHDNQAGHFLPIIERNSVVPISIVKGVQTAYDNQTELNINVYQGEHRLVEKNVFLGSLKIKVPKAPEGEEKVNIRYSYDVNGLLDVDVTVRSTGYTQNLLIEHSQGSLTPEEKEKSRARLAAIKFHPREGEKNRALLAKGERLYESSLEEKREYIADLLSRFEKTLDKQNPQEIAKHYTRLETILDELDNEDWL